MNTFEIIDWNKLIFHEWENSRWSGENNLEDFWNEKAEYFENLVRDPASSSYTDLITNFICQNSSLRHGDTVLDIGCGTGVLSLPLSSIAKKVTALDISGCMLKVLTDILDERNIENVELVNNRWMDEEKLQPHDFVISHRSLGVSAHSSLEIPDYKSCLQKMNRHAKKAVFIIFPAFRLPESRDFSDTFSDFDFMEQEGGIGIGTFNLIYSLGYAPSFRHLYFRQNHTFETIDGELENYAHFDYFRKDERLSRLKDYLLQTTEKKDGLYTLKTFKRIKAIFWKKDINSL